MRTSTVRNAGSRRRERGAEWRRSFRILCSVFVRRRAIPECWTNRAEVRVRVRSSYILGRAFVHHLYIILHAPIQIPLFHVVAIESIVVSVMEIVNTRQLTERLARGRLDVDLVHLAVVGDCARRMAVSGTGVVCRLRAVEIACEASYTPHLEHVALRGEDEEGGYGVGTDEDRERDVHRARAILYGRDDERHDDPASECHNAEDEIGVDLRVTLAAYRATDAEVEEGGPDAKYDGEGELDHGDEHRSDVNVVVLWQDGAVEVEALDPDYVV